MNSSIDFSATLPGYRLHRRAPTVQQGRLPGLLPWLNAGLRAWRASARPRHDLGMLNDHLLRDIGLSKSNARLISGKFDL